jgi:hypothetical protein
MPGSHRVTLTLWNACTLRVASRNTTQLGRLWSREIRFNVLQVHHLVAVPKVVALWCQQWDICLWKHIIMCLMAFIWVTEVSSHQHNCTKVYCMAYQVLLVIEKKNHKQFVSFLVIDDLYVYIMCLYPILFSKQRSVYFEGWQDFCLLSHQTLLALLWPNYLSIFSWKSSLTMSVFF